MRALLPAALADSYESVHGLLKAVCRGFARRYPEAFLQVYHADLKELLSAANEFFMDAYHSHDPARGRFRKRVAFVVFNRLVETARAGARRQKILPRTAMPRALAGKDRFEIKRFLGELSADAALVARTALRRAPRKGLDRKRVLREVALELGWAAGRVLAAFRELRDALS